MDEMSVPISKPGVEGFTLLELLVVLTILVVLAVVTLPSMSSAMSGSNLSRAGVTASDTIQRARQEAVARSREVQVRFYKFSSADLQGWRGLQIFRIEQTASGRSMVAASRVTLFPEGTALSSNAALSPILFADPALQGTTNLGSYGATAYAGFRYRPTGELSGEVNATNNFLTLQNITASGNPPANYYTLQINPVTGKVTVFRPQ